MCIYMLTRNLRANYIINNKNVTYIYIYIYQKYEKEEEEGTEKRDKNNYETVKI
jgi:hypothetical protein